ncbi:MAG: CBS domain-containing protein [Acidimicrobiales bacterium]
MAKTIREIMTPGPRALRFDASVLDAARTMRDIGVGPVVVLKADGSVCGIVTDRDVTVRAVAEGRDPATTGLDEICSHDLTTIAPDDDADEAVRMMRERAIRRLPVVEGGRPVGIVSLGDLAVERDPRSALADISGEPANP